MRAEGAHLFILSLLIIAYCCRNRDEKGPETNLTVYYRFVIKVSTIISNY